VIRDIEKELAEARARNAERHYKRLVKAGAVVLPITGKRRLKTHQESELEAARKNRPPRAKCNICGMVVSGKSLHLDHNHEHGYIRGWLCHQCNAGLGMFRDSPFIMGKAIEYISHYNLLYTPKKA
jgi:hypothetical protein